MSNANHEYDEHGILYLIDHAVVAHTKTVRVKGAYNVGCAGWSRIMRQGVNPFDNSCLDGCGKAIQGALRALDQPNRIGHLFRPIPEGFLYRFPCDRTLSVDLRFCFADRFKIDAVFLLFPISLKELKIGDGHKRAHCLVTVAQEDWIAIRNARNGVAQVVVHAFKLAFGHVLDPVSVFLH